MFEQCERVEIALSVDSSQKRLVGAKRLGPAAQQQIANRAPVSLILLAAPWFVMLPGMGMGIAGARTPHPTLVRVKSVVSHVVFGFGLFVSALALQQLRPL